MKNKLTDESIWWDHSYSLTTRRPCTICKLEFKNVHHVFVSLRPDIVWGGSVTVCSRCLGSDKSKEQLREVAIAYNELYAAVMPFAEYMAIVCKK